MEDHNDIEDVECEGAIPFWIRWDESLAGGRGMTLCYIVGISGWCGPTCPVLKAGECEHQDEIEQESEK